VEALTYLHNMGYCHCDLKPDNILVDSNGHYFLTDFGITHRIGDRPDTKLGTPKYMSPEQHQQQQLDIRTDVYAFAIIVYELLTNGEVPFSNLVEGQRTNVANAVMKWEHAHIYDNALPPSVYNRHIRPEIDRILLKALSKDANNRQPTMDVFYRELRNALEGRDNDRDNAIQRGEYQTFPSDMLPGGQLVCTYAPTTRHLLHNQIPLQRQMQFGRRRNSTIALQGGDVSRRHALVTWDGQRQNYVIYDQGSAMGTRVNGRLLTTNQPRVLQTGDLITVGEYNFRFELN
jgi:serine/threonine protein kinase